VTTVDIFAQVSFPPLALAHFSEISSTVGKAAALDGSLFGGGVACEYDERASRNNRARKAAVNLSEHFIVTLGRFERFTIQDQHFDKKATPAVSIAVTLSST
jgi:hypothetical protein